ncbi:MAG: Cobalt-zinc-cadmium resistance protein CzcC precursor [bacterium ADurb.Bin236]|nr:MAG: Cobalt-zinc-cadmium resistance protein CzcC precursor [bacterium ADurb.Bin236]HOY64258.1 TolC family protein [bacterium]HPN93549.1 TolC family protein [bacterium]
MKSQKNKFIKMFLLTGMIIVNACHAQGVDLEKEISLADAPITLDRAISIAMTNSRSLKATVVELEKSRNQVSEARAQFGTQIGIEATYQRVNDPSSLSSPVYMPMDIQDYFNPGAISATGTAVIGGYGGLYVASPEPTLIEYSLNKDWQHGVDLKISKPLIVFGKREDAVNSLKRQREQALLGVEVEKVLLTEKVKESFFNLLLMKEVVKTQKQSLAQAEAHYKVAESRHDVGMAPKFSVIRAKVEVESARESLAGAEKGLELSRMALNNTLGLPVENKTEICDSGIYQTLSLKEIEYYHKLGSENRLELEQIKLTKDQVLLAGRLQEMKPSIAFAGIYNLSSRGSGFGSENSWRAVIAGDIPLFDAGISRTRKAQSKRTYDKVSLSETDLKEGIALQISQAYLSLGEAELRLETSAAMLEAAEEAYRMADIGFKEGVTAAIDLIDAEHALTQARLNRAKSKFDYETAKAKLAAACGLTGLE